MSKNRKLVRAIQNFYQRFQPKSPSTVKEQSLWLLRSFIVTKKRPEWVNAGFVLPTVAMVSLVVVLLTIAILFRSFERSKNASNVRVNQAVLNAATPAIDRARAKIDRLFNDPRLPRSTPNDFSLKQIISDKVSEFTFGDETQLTLFDDVNGDGTPQINTSNYADDENLKTAWKYPVDTDNNGKFDSYTLYSIQFRNPPQTNGNPTRARSPLEARTPPMNETRGGGACDRGNNTSAQLVGTQGWYQNGDVLKRSLFVYTTTIPITDTAGLNTTDTSQKLYETFKGNKGFAALEYQQDRERRSLTNNAVVYDDDLEISPGGGINLNGRIMTNSNLLTARRSDTGPIRFFLVSSPDSCYFNERNSKIVVGGNVANARASETSDKDPVKVDLFSQMTASPTASPAQEEIKGSSKSINENGGNLVAYNSRAYEKRIQLLVDAAAALPKSSLPTELEKELDERIAQAKDATVEKKALLRSYFRKRTRRVPYAEVSFANSDDDTEVFGSYNASNVLGGTSGDSMRPPEEWVFPFDPDDGKEEGGYAELPLKSGTSGKINLPAKKTDFPEPQGAETLLGDRVLVGNNLPQMWWDGNKFVSQEQAGQEIQGKVWDDGGTRKRFPQISQLDDLGATGRDQFWEESAAIYPADALDVVGGLRVVTGAGIYLPNDYASDSSFTNTQKIVWPDSMPMGVTESILSTGLDPTIKGLPHDQTPYLQMRATAVYHFQSSHYNPKTASTNPQTPIACVSSYYNPTNETTAQNAATYKSKTIPWNTDDDGLSNNGIVYDAPTLGKSSYTNTLAYLASLKYPSGRLVHKQLKKALDKGDGNLTLAEKSALDSAICGLQIRDGSLNVQTTPVIPHGAIRETAFLDARQVKALDRLGTTSETTYNLDVELRQPLEIRATVLDLGQLKNTEIGTTDYSTTEFLLPNSGIIYATRDDALPDLSDDDDPNDNDDKIATSATDFKLDPTRRPNGIMLINGEELNRTSDNRNQPEEKGLILVSNLPVYIKGDFNKHEHEEFTDTLASDWSDFYQRTSNTLNSNFACRENQFTGCVAGEKWRPATVLADAITVLSGGFQEGFRNEGDYGLRDNWGYAPLGYDVDGVNGIDNTQQVTLNENLLKLDLNGDGDTTDTTISTLSEVILGVDLNNDGDKTDISVDITERNIPSVVARRLNGFWDNDFVTSFPWRDNPTNASPPVFGFPSTLDATPVPIQSSYFNNFVTPIQRRASFPEYVMEICRKPTVSACKPEDWSVGSATGGVVNWNFKAVNAGTNRIQEGNAITTLGAGTTARPALNAADRGFPRRVAFLRDTTGNLILDENNSDGLGKVPIVLGISGTDSPANSTADDAGQVKYYRMHSQNTGKLEIGTPSSGTSLVKLNKFQDSNRPRLHPRALWFKTRNYTSSTESVQNYGYKYPLWVENLDSLTETSSNQPLLTPVLQIQYPFREAPDGRHSAFLSDNDDDIQGRDNNWVQNATNPSGTNETQTNLVFAQGDTPARPSESNGGLENFVRYLEKWTGQTHKASGSFIQYKRSSYATAPWYPIIATYGGSKTLGFSTGGTILGYPQIYRTTVNKHGEETFGRTPFYVQPANRAWGFDVALLTQLPDLFSQRFTAPPSGEPSEFYREVSRDDSWVSTLLCAAESQAKPAEYGTAPSTKYGSDKEYAIPQNQRPSQCQ
ncbi:hormogonium polysaccharide biosynthesis protein HpsA [Calothrix sp. CCY 0018]|uniref:hormogonium polysaccharide biosynthesis protein HpsA n=1 Tax=Calothrix sp. CCY 0018 TaxID=3103864 RepID=UPI0039C65F0F